MSSVELSLRLHPAWNPSAVEVADAAETDLRYRLFLGDVRLVIGTSDFSAPWGWVPILDFLLGLHAILHRIHQSHAETFEFTESEAQLRFALVDRDVEVGSNYVAATGRVPLDEFRAVVRQVAEHTLVMLRDTAPGLEHNPTFRRWVDELSGLAR